MAFLTAFVGLVALVQGLAWLGARRRREARWGTVVAPAGLLVMVASLVTALVPGFWG